jgi:hypothetical protein
LQADEKARTMLDSVRRSLRSHVRFIKVSGVVYALLIPLLAGVFAVYYDQVSKINPLLFWLSIVIFGIVACVYAYLTVETSLAPEIYLDLDEAHKTITNLSQSIRYLSLLQGQITAWNSLTRGYANARINGLDQLKSELHKFMDPIIESREEYFKFERSELWNFAVYWWDSERALLVPIWRDKHPNHPSIDMGREWREGEGHVGHAFRNRQTLITADAMEQGIRDVLVQPQKERPYDAQVYRSYVSQPINRTADDAHPHGVLVATSDCPRRFDQENALVLLHASSALAGVVEFTYDSAPP